MTTCGHHIEQRIFPSLWEVLLDSAHLDYFFHFAEQNELGEVVTCSKSNQQKQN